MNHLIWGGCDTVDLAGRYGTPLYVMDETMLRDRCRRLSAAVAGRNARVCYAGKAFLNVAMARLVDEEGLCLDTVSPGEFRIACAAGFPMERVTLHGNAKTEAFLAAGLERGVGTVAVDSEDELALLARLCAKRGARQKILLRLSPGIEAHTHRSIQTAQKDCKFGVPLAHLECAVRFALGATGLDLAGLHVHVGSQIRDVGTYLQAADRMTEIMRSLRETTGFAARELDLGGGFAIPERPGAAGAPAERFVAAILDRVDARCAELGLARPEVAFEPGRWIAGEAGITLYTVQGVKEIPGVRTYVAVDGGMTDNPRPQLYQAEYGVRLANDTERPANRRAAIAGPCCETGDVLTLDTPVPEPRRGDVLAVPLTGAYNYSMFSTYNCALRPAVIFARDGQARVAVRRQTLDELLNGQTDWAENPRRRAADGPGKTV